MVRLSQIISILFGIMVILGMLSIIIYIKDFIGDVFTGILVFATLIVSILVFVRVFEL